MSIRCGHCHAYHPNVGEVRICSLGVMPPLVTLLTPEPGETVLAYITRRHRGGCTCPSAYTRCRYAVQYDDHHGDRSRGHGGWGWP